MILVEIFNYILKIFKLLENKLIIQNLLLIPSHFQISDKINQLFVIQILIINFELIY